MNTDQLMVIELVSQSWQSTSSPSRIENNAIESNNIDIELCHHFIMFNFVLPSSADPQVNQAKAGLNLIFA